MNGETFKNCAGCSKPVFEICADADSLRRCPHAFTRVRQTFEIESASSKIIQSVSQKRYVKICIGLSHITFSTGMSPTYPEGWLNNKYPFCKTWWSRYWVIHRYWVGVSYTPTFLIPYVDYMYSAWDTTKVKHATPLRSGETIRFMSWNQWDVAWALSRKQRNECDSASVVLRKHVISPCRAV